MENYTVKCNNCDFSGGENDLEKIVEFKEKEDSEDQYLAPLEFKLKYESLDSVYESEIINGCPNCLMDECLMDVETVAPEVYLEYKEVEVYHLYKDNEFRDSVWEYHYTIDPSDTDGFDIRKFSTYNKDLSIKENLKMAINNNLL